MIAIQPVSLHACQMKSPILIWLICCALPLLSSATRISGKVLTETGFSIPFATILVKGTTTGTTSNTKGEYVLDLTPGEYTIVCQHIGYEKKERNVTVANEPIYLNFSLRQEQLTMQEIVVRPGGEDPAYEIIRQAIRQRGFHQKQVSEYTCEVYIKGLIRLSSYPKSLFGQKITFEDADTSKEKIIYLSETLAKFAYAYPDRQKVEVISTRVSGQSNSYGFGSPQMISFYENNVELSRSLNPRGFVSPIADNALQFYRYKYLGAFFEDGRQISKIQVTPKRRFEPLFSGVINIVENDWNIHSLQLRLNKESQMEFVDQLQIQQLYVPVTRDIWMLKSQTILPIVSQFGFNANGHFTSVYSGYDVQPAFRKKFFGRTLIRYDSASNKRGLAYWDSLRPLPLIAEELNDFRRKDSLETLREDPAYLDSLDKRQNKLTAMGFLLNGQTMLRRKDDISVSYDPLLTTLGFNTVEGWLVRLSGTVSKGLSGNRRLSLTPTLRYGFTNRHLNASLRSNYQWGGNMTNNLSVSGGKRVIQFNNTNPIPQLMNSVNTLLYGHNYMKIYETKYLDIRYTKGIGAGFTFRGGIQFQDRLPLENTDTTTYWGRNKSEVSFTPNYPQEISPVNITPHQALVASFSLTYRPGSKYIEYPDRRLNVASKSPLFELSFYKGIHRVLGSDVDYGRWRFSVTDNLNFRLAGESRYRVVLGGFIGQKHVQLPDYQHFNGNRVLTAGQYLRTFQLAPYYANSNRDAFFATLHYEHSFNGALTNKIPLIRKLNLRLVTGANAFMVDRDNRYAEFFFGLDNIMKIIRMDYVFAYNQNGFFDQGLKISVRGFTAIYSED